MAGGRNKKRPYWHVDAKWIAGIIFLVFFITGILFLNISQIISSKNVIDTATGNIESSIEQEISIFFDNQGKPLSQDKEVILEALNLAKDRMKEIDDKSKSNASELAPSLFSNKISILKNPLDFGKKLATLSAYKLEGVLYGRISEALNTASDKISTLDLKETNIKDTIMEEVKIPKIYSSDLYHHYRNNAIIFLFIALVLLIIAIYFSSGFGRLSSPGFLILMSSIPGFLIFKNFDNYLKTSSLNALLSSDQKVVRILADSILGAFNQQVDSIFNIYKYLFFGGLILLVIGILGSVIAKIAQPKSTAGISQRLK